MTNYDPIEKDSFYNRLSELVFSSNLNPAERVLFLSSFESWYHFHSYDTYSSIASKAIDYFESPLDAARISVASESE